MNQLTPRQRIWQDEILRVNSAAERIRAEAARDADIVSFHRAFAIRRSMWTGDDLGLTSWVWYAGGAALLFAVAVLCYCAGVEAVTR